MSSSPNLTHWGHSREDTTSVPGLVSFLSTWYNLVIWEEGTSIEKNAFIRLVWRPDCSVFSWLAAGVRGATPGQVVLGVMRMQAGWANHGESRLVSSTPLCSLLSALSYSWNTVLHRLGTEWVFGDGRDGCISVEKVLLTESITPDDSTPKWAGLFSHLRNKGNNIHFSKIICQE